jgi:hypothetical protein
MAQFLSKFEPGEHKLLDGEILVLVQAVMFRDERKPVYEVSWLHNGQNQEIWVTEVRLT